MSYLDDFFESANVEVETEMEQDVPVTPGIFTEAAENYRKLSKAFDVSMMQVDAYMEACDREYNLHLKQAELKCLKENGTMDDYAYLESAAEEGAVAKIRKVVDKIIKMWENFISTVKTKIIAKIASAETRQVLSRAEKKVKLNPLLARKKVKIRDIRKPLGVIKKYKASTDKAAARAVKGLFTETNLKTLQDSKELFREEFRNAIAGEVALTTITIAALLTKLNSEVEKLPSYVDGMGKNHSAILEKLKVTVGAEAAASATAATNACAAFSTEIAKAEVNTHVDAIMNMIAVLKDAVIRQKGNKDVKAIEESAEDQIDEGFAFEESGVPSFEDFDKMVDDIFEESADDSEEIFGKTYCESEDESDFDALVDEAFEESGETEFATSGDSEDFFGDIFTESAEDDDVALYEAMLASI